ncbi:MAG: hypothetical protein DRQ88_10810 [Epsilonproteobacteria bacterium]|nr:MAG: hypothetical protein DRQ88_10810 [Campylobacterota bacterium]RLA65773.1 MAG: hypothetical protein DRQ89_00015 [Campylobacterota bacterium]
MVLRIAIFLLIPTLCFSQGSKSSFIDLKTSVETLERKGTNNLTQKKIDNLKEIISNAEDVDQEDYDELEDRLNKLIDSWLKKKLSGGWNILVGIISWTYGIDLPLLKQKILSDETGACGGGGYDWQNHWYGFGVDLCVGGMKGKSTVKLTKNLSLLLDLPVFMMISRPKVFWRPGEHTRLFFSIPLVYRYGFSTDPTYKDQIKGGSFSAGFFLGGEWEISDIVLGSSIGKILDYESTSWNFTLGYRF